MRKCPQCGGELEPFASADIGVGVQDFGPWGCPLCHWSEGWSEYCDEDELDEYDITGAGDQDL